MQVWRTLVAVAVTGVLLVAGGVAGGAATAAPGVYYVSMGDSLAAGFQVDRDTDHGYVDVAAASWRSADAGLAVHKLGCPGETVRSMLSTSVCRSRYAGGSQLRAAETFLRAHRGQTKYLTIDIGANDITACANLGSGTLDVSCAAAALVAVTKGLATILARVHAADPSVPVAVGVTYYDPYLPAGLIGADAFAAQSLVLLRTLDLLETAVYARYGYRVADVATAFHSGQTTPATSLSVLGATHTLAYDAATVCRLTRVCQQRSDIHPNDDGYRVIGRAVLAAAGR